MGDGDGDEAGASETVERVRRHLVEVAETDADRTGAALLETRETLLLNIAAVDRALSDLELCPDCGRVLDADGLVPEDGPEQCECGRWYFRTTDGDLDYGQRGGD